VLGVGGGELRVGVALPHPLGVGGGELRVGVALPHPLGVGGGELRVGVALPHPLGVGGGMSAARRWDAANWILLRWRAALDALTHNTLHITHAVRVQNAAAVIHQERVICAACILQQQPTMQRRTE